MWRIILITWSTPYKDFVKLALMVHNFKMHTWAFFWLIIILRKSWWGGTRPWNVSFATPPNSAQVQFLPFTYSKRTFHLQPYTQISHPWTIILTMNMKTSLLNINPIASKKESLLVLDVRKTRNERELHLFPSPIFLEANNLTKAVIEHKYISLKTWCCSLQKDVKLSL